MEIRRVTEEKRRFLPLLLLGDEQEDMIDAYLDRGTLYALYDGGALRTVCVVTEEAPGVVEIKNLATAPESQRRGYGRAMIDYVARTCGGRELLVGTGDSPLTVPFYVSCGFRVCGRVRNYFPDHYDHPIFEAGRRLTDQVILSRKL